MYPREEIGRKKEKSKERKEWSKPFCIRSKWSGLSLGCKSPSSVLKLFSGTTGILGFFPEAPCNHIHI